MKITKKQLKQLIKEEILKETDWYDVEKETPPPLSKGAPTAELDVEALRQVLQDANDAYDPDEPDSVYSVVMGVERALKLLEPGGEAVQLTTPTGASHRRMRGQQRTTGAKLSPGTLRMIEKND